MNATERVVSAWALARKMCGCALCKPALPGLIDYRSRPCQVRQAFREIMARLDVELAK